MTTKPPKNEANPPNGNSPGTFNRLARKASRLAGHPVAFGLAAGAIVIWAICGPIFGFSDTWQLVINTATTIITFLMVFLIQNTQNRDSEALQLKLDELIRASEAAHDALLDIEELTDEELDRMKIHYQRLAQRARVKQAPSRTEKTDS